MKEGTRSGDDYNAISAPDHGFNVFVLFREEETMRKKWYFLSESGNINT